MAVTQFINSVLSAVEVTDYLDAELNELAIDGEVSGVAIDNHTNRHTKLKVWVNLAAVDLHLQSSPGIHVRLIEALGSSSTVFEDDDDTAWGITLPLEIGTASQIHKRSGDFLAPPGYFKLVFVNRSGVALASTGNVMGYSLYSTETDI